VRSSMRSTPHQISFGYSNQKDVMGEACAMNGKSEERDTLEDMGVDQRII